jgi:hypothetical protein
MLSESQAPPYQLAITNLVRCKPGEEGGNAVEMQRQCDRRCKKCGIG